MHLLKPFMSIWNPLRLFSWETTFPKGEEPRTKHWKQHTIDPKRKNILTYVVLKQKSLFLAIEIKLTL